MLVTHDALFIVMQFVSVHSTNVTCCGIYFRYRNVAWYIYVAVVNLYGHNYRASLHQGMGLLYKLFEGTYLKHTVMYGPRMSLVKIHQNTFDYAEIRVVKLFKLMFAVGLLFRITNNFILSKYM
jgi:hypothetical protein